MKLPFIPLLVSSCVLALGCSGDAPADDVDSTGSSSGASTGSGESGATSSTGPSADSSGEGTTAGGETASDCAPAGGELVREDVVLQAADGLQIAATVARPAEGECLPGVLLVHQFTMSRAQWDDVLPPLVDAGFVALAIDLRGHGDSDPQPGPFNDLLTDPDQAPLDVAAGLQWLSEHEAVDPDRLGVVGTSIGANLSVVALHEGRVRAAVPVSPRLDPILSLAGMPAALMVSDVFCLAADGDGGGAQAQTCTDLVAQATGEARLEIIEGSSAHGVAIIDGFPEVVPEIITWLGQRL